jgi:hypothetical protein
MICLISGPRTFATGCAGKKGAESMKKRVGDRQEVIFGTATRIIVMHPS